MQDVFSRPAASGRATVRHWRGLLRRLATLGALAKRRQRRHHASLSDVSPLDLKSPSPDESAMRQEEESRLRDAVAALPEREGAVFALRYFEKLIRRNCRMLGHQLFGRRRCFEPGAA